MDGRCPDIINCTQSVATYFVEGIASSLFETRGMTELVPSNDPVWILGEKYSSLHDMDGIKDDIRSKFWITYRKGFPKIDGSGPSSDFGWGCMLRCGQMVLSQALILKHLGRQWRWSKDKKEMIENGSYKTYLKILSLFLDRKASPYSIHQISQMGATEGKAIGTWFGPNTVCQVLKKLSEYDKWNKWAVHICCDNLVIIDEIKESIKEAIALHQPSEDEASTSKSWCDLLLFIPVRLGLNEFNKLYYDAIKNSFRLPQSLGIIGGRPNHALHFIGCVGNEMIYFDPHTTQYAVDPEPLVDIDTKSDEDLTNLEFDDSTYHNDNAFRLEFSQLDPSMAMCFYFRSEEDFDSWCTLIHSLLVKNVPQSLFELFKERPYKMLNLSPNENPANSQDDYDTGAIPQPKQSTDLAKESEEEDFEILSGD
uniref:Cysteine protease n=3 Tax=Tetranychus urticae TaxID=32264 RepID=T1KA70_TETUR